LSADPPVQPRRRAVALSYDPATGPAPVVRASGQGLVADEILRRAAAAGVTIHQDRELVALLSRLDVGALIPPELYQVVAEVLAYVYRLEARLAGSDGQPGGRAAG
jgi:flagellar biosynthesis protein